MLWPILKTRKIFWLVWLLEELHSHIRLLIITISNSISLILFSWSIGYKLLVLRVIAINHLPQVLIQIGHSVRAPQKNILQRVNSLRPPRPPSPLPPSRPTTRFPWVRTMGAWLEQTKEHEKARQKWPLWRFRNDLLITERVFAKFVWRTRKRFTRMKPRSAAHLWPIEAAFFDVETFCVAVSECQSRHLLYNHHVTP